jgi:hypothetical protein
VCAGMYLRVPKQPASAALTKAQKVAAKVAAMMDKERRGPQQPEIEEVERRVIR